MGLFQPAPISPEDLERCKPIDIPADEVAEMDEDTWYEEVYRGDDVPQLTARAVLMGSFLGFFLAFTNLYIGLKTGWHLGVAITACILSYTIWSGMLKAGLAKTPMTILENNCMQSTASAAGYSTGGTMVSAIPALLILSVTPDNPQGTHIPLLILVLWTAFLAVLGVTLAIPMKRNMINQERLKFPSGLAAAATLQSLYASGEEAARKGKALLYSALFGAAFPPLIDLNATEKGPLVPGHSSIFDWIPVRGTKVAEDGKEVALKAHDWLMVMDHNPVMIAAGALVGLRVTLSMMLGALVLIFVVGPIGLEGEWTNLKGELVTAVTKPSKAWKELGLWLGAPMMVSAGLLGFAFQWRTIARAFTGMMGSGKSDGDDEDVKSKVEVPISWFALGTGLAGAGTVAIAAYAFDVPVYLGALAVVLTFALALVACRATGESDITPTGAMGKIMQLTYGVLIPQSATANLMTAGITAGSASAAADLLNDLKSGYLLGANPRRQFIAQGLGIFSGTVATVTGWYLLVPDATILTGTETTAAAFPAPAAQAWRAVAEVFREGIGNMHPMHQKAIYVGLILGAVFTALEILVPKVKKVFPSPTGIGLGLILPFQYPMSMLIGALIAYFWQKKNPSSAKDYLVPVSAGIIAGVSIIGVIVAALNNFVLA